MHIRERAVNVLRFAESHRRELVMERTHPSDFLVQKKVDQTSDFS
jgi:hypothetical protein